MRSALPAIIVQYPEWLEGKAVLLYQNGVKRYSMLPNTPTMTELATSESFRKVSPAPGRPIVPGGSASGVAELIVPESPDGAAGPVRTSAGGSPAS